MSTTKFGKKIRELRRNKGVNLKEVADSLGVSSAYVSSLELGKKNVPSSFITKLKGYFNLDDVSFSSLVKAAEDSVTSLKIDLKQDNELERELVTKFARTYKSLDIEKQKKIEKILMGK